MTISFKAIMSTVIIVCVSGALYTAHAETDSDAWDNEDMQDTSEEMEAEEVSTISNHGAQIQNREMRHNDSQPSRQFYGTMMNNPKDEESPDPGEPVVP